MSLLPEVPSTTAFKLQVLLDRIFIILCCVERGLRPLSVPFINQRLVAEEYFLSSSAKSKGCN